jgi:hypothetical protein
MATGSDVLTMLIPDGGWVIYGDNYEDINFIEATPITQKEFETGFAKYDAWKAKEDAAKSNARKAILERLGITSEEAALILG